MVFTDQSIKIRTRVRSALGRLRPSKSSLGLASLSKIEWVPPMPLPVLDLPKGLSDCDEFDNFLDRKSAAPVLLKRSDKKLSKRPAARQQVPNERSQLPVLDQMLLQQGLLNSPISIHLTTLLAESAQYNNCLSFSRATRRRSSSDSVYSTSLLCLRSAGPFTPELVINHVAKSTPELSATLLNVGEPQSCLPVITCTDPSASPLPSISGSSPNPSLRAVKLSASPAHRCLKRRGLIPSSQPITSQLLQSVVCKSTLDLGTHPELKNTPEFKLQKAALSAKTCVWTDDSDKRDTIRPQKVVTRQPLALRDNNLLPLPSCGRNKR